MSEATHPTQSETNIPSVEVAVIGAGLSGLSAAIELAKLGHSNIAVFDREETAGGVPRHCGHTGLRPEPPLLPSPPTAWSAVRFCAS